MMQAGNAVKGFDVEKIREDFPILHQEVNGHPLVYLDNAATTQKPNAVIDAISDYYRGYNSNVHRGAHALSDKATAGFEGARDTLAAFINSPSREQVLWTRGTTEAINLVAFTWGKQNLEAGDRVLVSNLEHHSNIVPWQMVAQEKGASVVAIPVSDSGAIDLDAFKALLVSNEGPVKFVSVGHVSNALGTVNPVEEIVALSHEVGAKVLIDGAQSVGHWAVDVQALDCDFFAFSGHKMFGPTGIGVLWGKRDLLEAMPPYQGGGEMIETVSFEGTTYNALPYKYEAGTPDIAGAIGLAAAVDYLNSFDREAAVAHENDLLQYAWQKAEGFAGLTRVGTAPKVAGVFSFLLNGAHPSDVGMLIDQQGVAVRTGHHCAQPLMARLGIPGTVRASFSFYNNRNDVDRLFEALEKAKTFLV
ncbi:aminotransferase class V-fold PLP-dependent enzyme [Saccharophagus degradans]|uniref:Cysteine desulfurase n=1 Tax=Saccharophagus degradans (strain 2-40 / ATCC 43961 / DSM 17024) TaxID=203122 RepID=Q21KV0_SACD2|nr:cysteine desulfurase [Saccharophagus degradans]ABD80679.1 cysteine desulfurase [Saccharophagus degradans 2-40]